MSEKIAFLAADTDSAQAALHELTEIYGQCDFKEADYIVALGGDCLLYTSPNPRDRTRSRMPSSA